MSKKVVLLIFLLIILVAAGLVVNKFKLNEPLKLPNLQSTPTAKKITENEVLDFFTKSATPSAQEDQYLKRFEELAKENNVVELDHCRTSNVLLKSTESKIKITNIGKDEIRISLADKKTTIKSHDTEELSLPEGVLFNLRCSSTDKAEITVALIKIGYNNLTGESLTQRYLKQAVAVNPLEFNKCEPTPKVVKIKKADKISVKNNNSFEISLFFIAGKGSIVKIPANSTLEVTPQLQGQLSWYNCSASQASTVIGHIVTSD